MGITSLHDTGPDVIFLVALHVRVAVLTRRDADARPSRPTNRPVVSAMASAWDGATARVAGHRLRRRTGAVVNYAEDVHLREDVPCGCALCVSEEVMVFRVCSQLLRRRR